MDKIKTEAEKIDFLVKIPSIIENMIENLKNNPIFELNENYDYKYVYGEIEVNYFKPDESLKKSYENINKMVKVALFNNKIKMVKIEGINDFKKMMENLPADIKVELEYKYKAAQYLQMVDEIYIVKDICNEEEEKEEDEEDEIPTPKSDAAVRGGAAGGEKTARELFEEQSKEQN